jgi:hypothetical protein
VEREWSCGHVHRRGWPPRIPRRDPPSALPTSPIYAPPRPLAPNPSHSEGLLPNPSVGDVREVKRRRRRQVRSLEGAVTAKSEPSVRREPDLTVVVHLYFLFPELVPPPRIFTSCIYRDRVLSLLWRLAVETWSQSILVRSLALCVVVDPIRATPSRVSPSPESQPSS